MHIPGRMPRNSDQWLWDRAPKPHSPPVLGRLGLVSNSMMLNHGALGVPVKVGLLGKSQIKRQALL